MIVVNLDVMMAKRKISLNELSHIVGITTANLSILKKQGKQRLLGWLRLMLFAKLWTVLPEIF